MNRSEMLGGAALLRPDQVAYLGALYGEAKAQARKSMFGAVVAGILFLPLLMALGVDYVLFYDVFSFLLASGDNGTSGWNASIMALVGVVAVVAYHCLAYRLDSPALERGMSRAAQVALPVFLLGAGLLLAGALWSKGVGALVEPSLSDEMALFIGEAVEKAENPAAAALFEEHILPVLPLIFVAGMGGMLILSVYVAHHLIGQIHRLSEQAFGAISKARAMRRELARLRELEREYLAVSSRLARREGGRPARELAIAEAIVNAGMGALRGAERLVVARQLNAEPDPADRLIGEREGIPAAVWSWDQKALEARVAAIRDSLAAERVLALIRNNR